MTACWHAEPKKRPTSAKLVEKLQPVAGAQPPQSGVQVLKKPAAPLPRPEVKVYTGPSKMTAALKSLAAAHFGLAQGSLKKSVEMGDPAAMMFMADAYLGGGWGLSGDPRKGVALLKESAEGGSGVGQAYLAMVMHDGSFAPRDEAAAAVWANEAVASGDPLATAMCYEHGLTVDPDHAKAAALYLQSATEKSHIMAMYFLGRCYEMGRGVKQDFKMAAEWYTKASQLGYAPAQWRMGLFLENGTGVAAEPK